MRAAARVNESETLGLGAQRASASRERGPAAPDTRRHASLDGWVHLPLRFKSDGILVARSGLPYAPLTGVGLSAAQPAYSGRSR